MALEQKDLDSIDQLLKSLLEPIWKDIDEMKEDLEALGPMRKDLDEMKEALEALEPMRRDIDEIKADFVPIRKDIDEMKEALGALEPIRKDINEMKGDLALLARLNQLDEIRKDARLRVLYSVDTKEA